MKTENQDSKGRSPPLRPSNGKDTFNKNERIGNNMELKFVKSNMK